MKILFVNFNDYLGPNGMSVVTRYLAEGLAKKNHDVKVFTAKRNKDIADFHKGVCIETFDVYYNRLKQPKGETEHLKKRIVEEDSDVIIFVSLQTPTSDCAFDVLGDVKAKKVLYTHDFAGLYLSFLKWKGDLFHSLGNTWNYLIWKNYYHGLVKQNINSFDLIISLSKLNRDTKYLDKYYRNKRVIIGNAAENIFFEDIKSSKKIVEKNYLVSVANYNHVKNQIFIMSEYYKTKASLTYSMVFCGGEDNSYLDRLKCLKKKLDSKYGYRNVVFLSGIDRQNIPALVKDASLYLCGSRWEAYSISLIEAMAVGTPFISLNVGNVEELPGGVVVYEKNKFSNKIDELIDSEILMRKYSMLGTEYAIKNCRTEGAIEALEAALNDLFV